MVTGHGSKFARKKEEAIAALLTHRNIDEAAQAAKIGTNTLLRWMKESEFDEAYRAARRQAVHQSIARLQQATGAAAITMLKLMADPNVTAAVRLRAAECVFAHAIKGVELEDIEARLAELERAADETKPGWWKK
jgi:hypothetical protein